MKLPDRWTWAQLKHRLVLTAEEKRVVIFVMLAFLLGLGTKCYRDRRPQTPVKIEKKRALLRKTYDALKPDGKFIIYQVTNELRQHATVFPRDESEYFLQNIPPMFITVFHKTPSSQGGR